MKSISEIEEICKKYKINNYTINEDGSIDVDGDVSLYKKELTELPLTFNKVTGDFSCTHNKLTTLKGSPKYVGFGFYCHDNELTSLEFGPVEVGGDFYCGRDFSCMDNNFTSLEFSPVEVGGDFYCVGNPKLYNLYGISDNINGLFYCYETPIESIFNEVDIDFIRAFNVYRVIKDDKIVLKRLKYVMDLFDMRYDLNKIKKHYEIN